MARIHWRDDSEDAVGNGRPSDPDRFDERSGSIAGAEGADVADDRLAASSEVGQPWIGARWKQDRGLQAERLGKATRWRKPVARDPLQQGRGQPPQPVEELLPAVSERIFCPEQLIGV